MASARNQFLLSLHRQLDRGPLLEHVPAMRNRAQAMMFMCKKLWALYDCTPPDCKFAPEQNTLRGFSIPKSSGISRRPVLLHQTEVRLEIERFADAHVARFEPYPPGDAWFDSSYPSYDLVRPEPTLVDTDDEDDLFRWALRPVRHAPAE